MVYIFTNKFLGVSTALLIYLLRENMTRSNLNIT